MIFPFLPELSNNNAICVKDKFFTYTQFRKRIDSIAFELSAHNYKNAAIGLVASDHVDTYAAIMAIWATGNIFVPLNPYHPKDRIESIVSQSEIKLILYSVEKVDSDKNFVCTLDLEEKGFTDIAQPKNEDIAYILFTSGSTGLPKGVPVSYGNVRSFLKGLDAIQYELDVDSKFLQMFDLSFDLSIVSILAPMIFKGCMFTVPNNDIKYQTVYRLLEEYDIEFAIVVPSIITYLRPYFEEICLEKMKHLCFSAEASKDTITSEFMKCCPNAKFYNLYGPTEATVFSLWYNIPIKNIPSQNGIISIGQPTIETEALIVDDENNIVKDGEKGELLLSGNQVISSYLKNEEKDKEAFVYINNKRYYRTGDICSKDGDLYFYLGRKDYQVKVRGFRIELSEIEHHITSYCNENRTVALASKDENESEIIVAIIESEEIDTEKLNEYLKSKMPFYMIPSKYYFMSKFPLNNNGKINRKEIEKIFLK